MKIFCDMDGVLCDWCKGTITAINNDLNTNYKPEPKGLFKYIDEHGKNTFWKYMEDYPEFWSGLDWHKYGKQTWNLIRAFNPTILSSPSSRNADKIIEGKMKWLRDHNDYLKLENLDLQLNPNGWDGKSKVILSHFKSRCALDESYVLIDDMTKNINMWNRAGGTGILFEEYNIEKTFDKIRKLKTE